MGENTVQECVTGLLAKSKVKKVMYEDARKTQDILTSGCSVLENTEECYTGKTMTMLYKGRARAPTITDSSLTACVTECGNRGRGKAVCAILRPYKCYNVAGLGEDIMCDYNELYDFMQDVSDDWGEYINQLMVMVALAATEGMAVAGMPTCTYIPCGGVWDVDGCEPDTPAEDLNAIKDTAYATLELQTPLNTIEPFNLMQIRQAKMLAGAERNKFTCIFVPTEIVQLMELDAASFGLECCSEDRFKKFGPKGTLDGMKLYETEHLIPKNIVCRDSENYDVASSNHWGKLYPILMLREDAVQVTDASNPKKTLLYDTDIKCDTEDMVSRRIFCVGFKNAVFVPPTDNPGAGNNFNLELIGGPDDRLNTNCDVANHENWGNGGYNAATCLELFSPLTKNTGSSTSPVYVPTTVANINRGQINDFARCDDTEQTPPEFAIPYNCPGIVAWVSIDGCVRALTEPS